MLFILSMMLCFLHIMVFSAVCYITRKTIKDYEKRYEELDKEFDKLNDKYKELQNVYSTLRKLTFYDIKSHHVNLKMFCTFNKN